MERQRAVAAEQLRASLATCALFVERGSVDLTVKEICSEISVSERTFYRYFPTKADVVGPYFAWTVNEFLTFLRTPSDDHSLRTVLNGAFHAALGSSHASLAGELFPLIFADEEIWSVYLRHMHAAELDLVEQLAPRLGLDPRSPACRAAASGIASATRIALETMVHHGDPPAQTFDAMLAAFENVHFDAPVQRPAAAPRTPVSSPKENQK